MSFISALQGTASALTAQRLRMDVISSNIANADTTRTADGGPYRRRSVVFQSTQNEQPFRSVLAQFGNTDQDVDLVNGVSVSGIVVDETPGRQEYDPSNPDANAEGIVEYPNVDTLTEMTDLISASRSYEANVTVATALKGMALKALEIGKS